MEVPSVDKVERNLLALYKKMVGPGAWPRTHVIERDAFLLIIKTCVFEFWSPTGEGDWATRWDWKKKTWVDDEETGKVEGRSVSGRIGPILSRPPIEFGAW